MVICERAMGRAHVIYSSLQIYEAAQELPSNIRFFSAWAGLGRNRLVLIFHNTVLISIVR